MAAPINTRFLIFLMAGVLLAGWAAGQNCGCASNLCCSQWGFCGTGDPYCGEGCREGPCNSPGGPGTSVESVVTEAFFNGIKSRSSGSCAGQNFYTRGAFINALTSYPRFGKEGSDTVAKMEIAAMFAHYTHETEHFCYIEEKEINGASGQFCNISNEWPCNPSKSYYGRGPIQLTWNYNYGPAGLSIGFDGLNAPETVARDAVVAFKTGFWFWMNNVHSLITSGQGFGATIRAINGIECNGGNSGAVNARVQYFRDYCGQFGVSPGDNLYC